MGLPFNLNRFGTTQKKRPYYCEVEYLESTGTGSFVVGRVVEKEYE